jgi:hypothetical protein
LAVGAAVDPLHAAVVARHVDRLRVAGEHLDAIGLDQQVDHECAAGLALAVPAVTAVREERLVGEAIADRTAGTATFARDAHPRPHITCRRARGDSLVAMNLAPGSLSCATPPKSVIARAGSSGPFAKPRHSFFG